MSQSIIEFDAKSFIKNLPNKPGVYRMANEAGDVIYVGKAINLRKRVSSYFLKSVTNTKVQVMVSHIRNIEFTVTNNETEALLLENNLIKTLKPRYNILYRDDKSYPYIYLSTKQEFPRLTFHRGAMRKRGKYFGPYPSSGAVRETLHLLQKIFPVRQCDDNFFKNRSRPCLQYQIKRCSAPCVGIVNHNTYQEDVDHAIMFLDGKSTVVINQLIEKMDLASKKLDFEAAARFRDQITMLQRIQEKQYINTNAQSGGNVDVISIAEKNGVSCIQLFYFRGGRNIGNKAFFPRQTSLIESDMPSMVEAFLSQHYMYDTNSNTEKITSTNLPDEILLNIKLNSQNLYSKALSQTASKKIDITTNVRGARSRWVKLAEQNAQQAIIHKLSQKATLQERFNELRKALALDELPARIECFDISHTQGEATVASCVVFDQQGAVKKDYRRFNIAGIQAGDDYAAMKQALMRRYQRIKKEEASLPDILLIDGGKGQVKQAEEVVAELQIFPLLIVGITKGPGRKPEYDSLYIANPVPDEKGKKVVLPFDSLALHLIQQIRDEAHRFAIAGHRQRRQKTRTSSVLEEIPGLGPKRRTTLLKHFGGIQQVKQAGIEDLCRIPGINAKLAQLIFDSFHEENGHKEN